MKTTMALLIKFVATFIASWIAFGIIDANSINWILTVAITGTALNYVIGDLFVLRSMGNVIALIGDGVLGAAIAYLIDLFTVNFITSVTGLIVFAVIIMFAEYFFHLYLLKDDKVAPNDFDRDLPLE